MQKLGLCLRAMGIKLKLLGSGSVVIQLPPNESPLKRAPFQGGPLFLLRPCLLLHCFGRPFDHCRLTRLVANCLLDDNNDTGPHCALPILAGP